MLKNLSNYSPVKKEKAKGSALAQITMDQLISRLRSFLVAMRAGFFQFMTALLCLAAVFTMLADGIFQVELSFANAIIAMAVHGLRRYDSYKKQSKNERCYISFAFIEHFDNPPDIQTNSETY
jgi:hypothetical protein